MSSEHLFAGLYVTSLDTARDFYERLIGREPDLLVPNEHEVAWQLHEGAWIVLIAGGEHAGGAQHTLIVDDIEAFLDAARGRGIEPGPIQPVGEGMRQSFVIDPDGNRLKVAARAAQPLRAGRMQPSTSRPTRRV
jgi:catechol 2,3-dioxygenase-like lactoylglutathione lyase family enzyme